MSALEVHRIDDIPLLYAQIKELSIQEIIDDSIIPHKNRTGISLGHVVSIWLCYLLSESDHRLSHVENWVAENLILLITLSEEKEMSSKDFTDDRLEQTLDYLSKASNWLSISNRLNEKSLEVYDIDKGKTIRLDAAPMQGNHKIKESGLFQYGYSKHHDARLGMLKIMLACVDNELNGFGYPLAHVTVSGEKADDSLYIPVLEECEKTFSQTPMRKLYVGDSKMGSKENRSYIVTSQNDYLVPLSKLQLSQTERIEAIKKVRPEDYYQVYKTNKENKKVLVAQGFEQISKVIYKNKTGEEQEWEERRVFVLSRAYSVAQQQGLENRIQRTTTRLQELFISKQGKQVPKSKEEAEQITSKLLKEQGLGKLLAVEIIETYETKKIRAYKDRPAREEHWSTFQVKITPNKTAINNRKKELGWQVYGTTLKKEELDFEKIVWKYRNQNRVESRFNDLRNKVVPLMPIFLKKDNRVEALINVLMICLKVCAVMEFKVAQQLRTNQDKLDNIFEGNPKRSTETPTAKRLLKQFKGVSIAVIKKTENRVPEILRTDLKSTQLKIIALLGFDSTIFTELPDKMKLFFSSGNISET